MSISPDRGEDELDRIPSLHECSGMTRRALEGVLA
jgi:hypothetical protein